MGWLGRFGLHEVGRLFLFFRAKRNKSNQGTRGLGKFDEDQSRVLNGLCFCFVLGDGRLG